MKLLRNPIFTTLLVIVAIVTVLYQLNSPRLGVGRLFRTSTFASATPAFSAAPAPAAAAKVAVNKGPAPGLTSTNQIDRNMVEVHFGSWVDWPKRDPFLLFTPEPDEMVVNTETNSPVPTWKLRAIWTQT